MCELYNVTSLYKLVIQDDYDTRYHVNDSWWYKSIVYKTSLMIRVDVHGILYNLNDSGWCKRLFYCTNWLIQDNVKVKFTKQCEWFELMWASRPLYSMSDSVWCERLVHFTVALIEADVNV